MTETTTTTTARTGWSTRLTAASGPAFVVLLFLGNSLAEAGTSTAARPSPAQTVADLEVMATGAVNRLGLLSELAGLVCLALFLAYLADLLRRRSGAGVAGAVALVGGLTTLAVKLSSGSALLAALAERDRLGATELAALVAANGAAFVLTWIPFGLFVAGAALALRRCGMLGRPLTVAGVAAGAASVVTGLVGAQDPVVAAPVGFLLSALWLLSAGLVHVARTAGASRDEDSRPALSTARTAGA